MIPARARLAAWVGVIGPCALAVAPAVSCPVDIDLSGLTITDGEISMDYVQGGMTTQSYRAADDFFLPASPGNYSISQAVVYMVASNPFQASATRIEFFTDFFNGTRSVPGTQEYLHIGAAAVLDAGPYPAQPTYHIYRVTFAFGTSSGPHLSAGNRHWLSVSVASNLDLPNFATVYAAAHTPVTNGLSMARNLTYPGGAWSAADDTCCLAPSDMVFRLIANPSASALSDFNCSGDVSVQDLFDYLTAYFGKLLTADINANGSLSIQDIFDFLSFFFAKT